MQNYIMVENWDWNYEIMKKYLNKGLHGRDFLISHFLDVIADDLGIPPAEQPNVLRINDDGKLAMLQFGLIGNMIC